MFRNYIKTAIRGFARSKSRSLLSTVGLAVGLACCLLLCLWAHDELSYDTFHANGDEIYQVVGKTYRSDGVALSSVQPGPVGPGVASEAAGVVDFTRIYTKPFLLIADDSRLSVSHGVVDSTFLTIFSFPLLQGDSLACLTDPYSVVLTQTTATKLFGEEDPLGRTVRFNSEFDVTVTAILADLPHNTEFSFEALVPISLYETAGYDLTNWGDSRFQTYVQLDPQVSAATVDDAIKYHQRTAWPETNDELYLRPLSDIHLHELGGGGAIIYVYIFLTAAFVVLAIACINSGNMTIASYSRRLRGLTLRRVIGASRWDVAVQIFGEVGLSTVCALALALLIVEIVLPSFNELSGKQLSADFNSGIVLAVLAGATLLTGLLAGSIPALILSSYRPLALIKASAGGLTAGKIQLVRRGLIVLQFTCCIALMVAAIVVFQQVEYVKSRNLGWDKENVLALRVDKLDEDFEYVKTAMKRVPGVLNATATYAPPAWQSISTGGLDSWDGRQDDERFSMDLAMVDFDYVETFGMTVIEGRDFSRDFLSDSASAWIVNEKAVAAMGMDSPLGKRMSWNGVEGNIVGVVKDFHLKSLKSEIGPFGMAILPWYNYLCLKIDGEQAGATIEGIRHEFELLRPGQEFSPTFLDEYVGNRYQAEARTGKIIGSFAILSVVIALLGLVALAAYSAETRTREIGIRKVLGASISGVAFLLSKESAILLLVSNVVAFPIAYFLVSRWLEDFAYRIGLGWEAFALAGVTTAVIAIATVSIQATQSARANPVEALKYE